MAVEKHEGGVMITGYHIDIFRIKAVETALALEIITGMQRSNHGRSTMQIAIGICGSPKRTKRGVLLDLCVWCDRQVPQWRPMSSTVKALADVRMSKKLRTALGL